MSLKDRSSNIYTYLPRIGQRLAAHFLLSVSILSWPIFLGKRFFKLKPQALSLSLIIYIPTAVIHLIQQKYIDEKMDKLVQRIPRPKKATPKKFSYHSIFVDLEKYLYLTVYFLSDTISVFQLINLLVIGSVNTIVVPIRGFAFLLSVIYAAYIHTYCREDDFTQRYRQLKIIVSQPNFQISFKPAMITLCVFTTLFLGFYLSNHAILASSLLILASALSIYYYKELYQFPYGIYLHLFAYKQLQTFTRLLVAQGRLFRLYGSLPRILYLIDYLFTGLSLSYMAIYYSSALRMIAINKQLNEQTLNTPTLPTTKHNPVQPENQSFFTALFSDPPADTSGQTTHP